MRWASGRVVRPPAGLIALSGFMPTVEGFELDPSVAAGVRVAIGHGSRDPVIGVEWGRDARERLEAAGADVTYHESAIGHQIDPRFLAELPDWLRQGEPSADSRQSTR